MREIIDIDGLTLEDERVFARSLHSREVPLIFCDEALRALSKIEELLDITGELAHLSSLGWNDYQWRYIPAGGGTLLNDTHFYEGFSPWFSGYIRGDSKHSLKEAVSKALQQAQRFAQCERTIGHEYEPYRGFKNGLQACKRCGFHGHTTGVGVLNYALRDAKLQLSVAAHGLADLRRELEAWGITQTFSGQFLIDEVRFRLATQEHEERIKGGHGE